MSFCYARYHECHIYERTARYVNVFHVEPNRPHVHYPYTEHHHTTLLQYTQLDATWFIFTEQVQHHICHHQQPCMASYNPLMNRTSEITIEWNSCFLDRHKSSIHSHRSLHIRYLPDFRPQLRQVWDPAISGK